MPKTFNIPAMGPEPVTAAEIEAELADLRRYYSSDKEWPHHRQQARDRAARISAEFKTSQEIE